MRLNVVIVGNFWQSGIDTENVRLAMEKIGRDDLLGKIRLAYVPEEELVRKMEIYDQRGIFVLSGTFTKGAGALKNWLESGWVNTVHPMYDIDWKSNTERLAALIDEALSRSKS